MDTREKMYNAKQKNVLKNEKLNCLRTNKIFFSLLGDKQNFKFGGI